MKVFTVSDIHIDYSQNLQWLLSLSQTDYCDDILILAGDISDKTELIEQCFKQVSNCFKQVLYVPGNHDLWVSKKQNITSIEKFYTLQNMANEYGVSTSPYHCEGLTIIPLLGWYDFSFGPASEYLQERWMDFYACKWGEGFDDLAAFSERELAITNFFYQ